MSELHPTSLRRRLADTATMDRRAWLRYAFDPDAPLTASATRASVETKSMWLASIRDISVDGIGLFLHRHFAQGEMITIGLTNAAKTFGRKISARVAHSTLQPGGGWLVGCAFSEPLSESDLDRLLEEPEEWA